MSAPLPPCLRHRPPSRRYRCRWCFLFALAVLTGCTTFSESPVTKAAPVTDPIRPASAQRLGTLVEVDIENGTIIARLSLLQNDLPHGAYLVQDQNLQTVATVDYTGIRHGNRIGLILTNGTPSPGDALVKPTPPAAP